MTKRQALELLILGVIVAGLQWTLESWEWTLMFLLGFLWNWSLLSRDLISKARLKNYRYSLIGFVYKLHRFIKAPFRKYPILYWIAGLVPAPLCIFLFSLLLQSQIYWVAALCGALSIELVRIEIRFVRKSFKEKNGL